MEGIKMVVCPYCDKSYSSVGTLNRHIQTIHGVKTIKGTMQCLSCENKFTRRMKLVEHLKNEHGQDFEVDILEFKTSEEFESWKAEEERRSVAMFRNDIVDRPSKNGSSTILICSRDGRARSIVSGKRQRMLKSQGSRKIDHTCTSHMTIRKVMQPESKVIVKYVKTHYGHEPEVQHINLTQTEKEKVAMQLALGVSEGRILLDASSNEDPKAPSRLETLNKKDIANIRNQYGVGILGGRRHTNKMKSQNQIRLFSQTAIDKDHNYDSKSPEEGQQVHFAKYSDKEQALILNFFNSCAKEKPSVKLGAKQLRSVQSFLESNDCFTDLRQIYALDGLGQNALHRLCERIVSAEEGLKKKVVKSSTQSSSNLLSPAIPSENLKNIKTVVGLEVGSSSVSWTKLDCEKNTVIEWALNEILPPIESKNITNVYNYVLNLREMIPAGDIYVMESTNWSTMSSQTSLANHIRDAQITATLIALLNQTGNTSVCKSAGVHFLKTYLPSRFFSTLVGTERVSSQGIVDDIFKGSSDTCSALDIDARLKDFYLSLVKPLREDMCKSLLLSITFKELVLCNRVIKLKAAKK